MFLLPIISIYIIELFRPLTFSPVKTLLSPGMLMWITALLWHIIIGAVIMLLLPVTLSITVQLSL